MIYFIEEVVFENNSSLEMTIFPIHLLLRFQAQDKISDAQSSSKRSKHKIKMAGKNRGEITLSYSLVYPVFPLYLWMIFPLTVALNLLSVNEKMIKKLKKGMYAVWICYGRSCRKLKVTLMRM